MPVLVAIVIVSFVVGLLARPAVARGVAVGLAALANAAFVWAIADGKGDDPAWLIVVSVAGGAVAVAAAHSAGWMRSSLVRATAR